MNMLTIKINDDPAVAPRYEKSVKELEIKTAVITAKGMEGGAPLIDLQLVDSDGKEYFAMVTGKLMIGLGSAIEGVMAREDDKGHH